MAKTFCNTPLTSRCMQRCSPSWPQKIALQDVDDKRKKAIKKAVEKEEKARAPVLKKAAQSGTYLEDLRSSVQQLSEQTEALNARLA